MQDPFTNNMAAVINSLYMSAVNRCVCVPFKILMWTLLACERRVNVIFPYVCIFAPYSKILTGVNVVHVNGALAHLSLK